MKFIDLNLYEYYEGNPQNLPLRNYVNIELECIGKKFWITPLGKSIWMDSEKKILYLPEFDSKGNQIKIQLDKVLLDLIEKNMLP